MNCALKATKCHGRFCHQKQQPAVGLGATGSRAPRPFVDSGCTQSKWFAGTKFCTWTALWVVDSFGIRSIFSCVRPFCALVRRRGSHCGFQFCAPSTTLGPRIILFMHFRQPQSELLQQSTKTTLFRHWLFTMRSWPLHSSTVALGANVHAAA